MLSWLVGLGKRPTFRVRLTSRTKRLLFLDGVVDTPELEDLRALVASELASWVGGAVKVDRFVED
jgi:hypothetical protein